MNRTTRLKDVNLYQLFVIECLVFVNSSDQEHSPVITDNVQMEESQMSEPILV